MDQLPSIEPDQLKKIEKVVLEFLNHTILVDGLLGQTEVALIRNGNLEISIVVVKYNRHLLAYRFNEDRRKLFLLDAKYNVFNEGSDVGRRWFLPNEELIVVQKWKSVETYRLNFIEDQLNMMKHVNVSGYDEILLGTFYKKSQLDAVVLKNNKWELMSHHDAAWVNQTMEFPFEIDAANCKLQVNSDFMAEKNVLLVKTASDLGVYQINDKQKLERIVKCTYINFSEDVEFDRIMFAKFGDTKYKDLLHFNTTGLNVYRFNDTTSNYEPHFYSTMFSKFRNWNADNVASIILHDIDNNGHEDLLFTAPAGFQVLKAAEENGEFYLDHTVLRSDKDIHRFMNVLAVLPKSKDGTQSAIFQKDGKLFLMDIKKDTLEIDLPLEVQQKLQPPSQSKLINPAEKYSRWLHEHLDLSDLLQPVNSMTGQLELSIPLVQLDNPFGISVRKTFQYRDIPGDDFLARGWVFPMDYIIVETRGSMFEHDYRYSIVRNKVPVTLVPKFETSTDEVIFFEVQDELEVKYIKYEQKWEMQDKEESIKYVFGNCSTSKALRYTDDNNRMKYPFEWYLAREEDSAGSFVQYEYQFEENSVKLVNITTDQKSSVKFHYEHKKMKRFTVETESYKQNVVLNISRINNKDYLAGFTQDNYTLFEFKYNFTNMIQIVYPNGLKSSFEYNSTAIDEKRPNMLELASEDYTINYGPDYSIIVSATPNKKCLQLNVRDLLGGQHTQKIFDCNISDKTDPFIAYQVFTLENLFGVIRSFKDVKIFNIFHFSEDKWNSSEQRLSNDAIITNNVNTIYITDKGSLKSIAIHHNEPLISHVQNITSNFVMRATHRGLLTYDDDHFTLQYSGPGQYLKGKFNFLDSNYIQSTIDVVNQFELTDDTKSNLMRALKLDMIQTYNKFIILRALEITRGIMKIRMRLKILGEPNKIINSDHWRVPLKKVEDMTLTVKTQEDGTCVLGYIKYLEKYRTKIRCTGPTIEKLENEFKNKVDSAMKKDYGINEFKDALLEFNDQMTAFEKNILVDNPMAFDVSLLGISVDESGIKTGGKLIYFNGTHWSQRDQSAAVHLVLRDKMRLEKLADASDTYKIYDDKKIIYDSNTTDSSSVKLVWPHYFASQSKGGPLSLYMFDKKEIIHLKDGEKLSTFSNNLVVVTTTDNGTKLSMLPLKYLQESSMDVLVKQTLELHPKVLRITTYEHGGLELDGTSNAYVFTKSKIIPGGNLTKYGWYEHSYDPKTRILLRGVKNSNGDTIKYIDPVTEENHEKPNPENIITDKTGRLPILNVSPLNVADGEYLYYGFEQYEQTSFNSTQRWKFNNKNLKMESGNTFLYLENDNTFEAYININNENGPYLFACWLKADTLQKIGDVVKYVEVSKEVDSRLLEVSDCRVQHSTVTGWFYAEMNLTTTNLPESRNITITIKPDSTKSLSIDHVRFAPMTVDFRAYVYRQPFWGVSRVMHNSGLMTEYLLDSHGNRVVYVNEAGKVLDFVTYSKSYYIRSSDNFPSVMEVRPRIGEIESFNVPSSWRLKTNDDNWNMQRGSLIHKSNHEDDIEKDLSTNCAAFVVRFVFNRSSTKVEIKLNVGNISIDVLCKSSNNSCKTLPEYGEIVVYISKTHKAIWFEGTLTSEESHAIEKLEKIGLTIIGSVTISEMLILYDPSLKITYYNRLGLPRQTITIQNENFLRIKEVLYDEIDRSIITTKWTTVPKKDNLFFGFHEKFIESVDPESHQLKGLVNDLNKECEGYPYFRKVYANGPTTEEVVISMPGKSFSRNPKYQRQLVTKSKYDVIDKLFPSKDGFTQRVEIRQSKMYHIAVHDANNKKVAYLIAADDSEDRLTTYEYDKYGHLVLELPPMYHNATATLNLTIPFWGRTLNDEETKLQEMWGVQYTYNEKGQIIRKRIPDSGSQYFYYDGDVVRFLVQSDNKNNTDKTVFFLYGPTGRIVKEAIVNVTSSDFEKYCGNSTMLPNSTHFVEYYHGDYDELPSLRHRSQHSIIHIDNKQKMESLFMDNAGRMLKKVYIVKLLNTSYSIDYEYMNDKLAIIRYPISVNESDFKISYSYNNAGDMISIGTLQDPDRFLSLQYNADGLVQEMCFEPGSSYSYCRTFKYNEPGYLKQIKDDFLEETVSYMEADGYGSTLSMIFEGLISRTTFNATWYDSSNHALSTLQWDSMHHINKTLAAFCINNLQFEGYYDKHLHPLKSFYPKLDGKVSKACRSNEFRRAFHANEFPLYYGHSYDYDSHEQLVKAKYFQSVTEASWKPLTRMSFLAIKELNETATTEIWSLLLENYFMSAHCYNRGMCNGIPGSKSLLNTKIPNESYAQALFLEAISQNKVISKRSFERKCLGWFENVENCEIDYCSDLSETFFSNHLIDVNSNETLNALAADFREILKPYAQYIPQIVGILHEHFATSLGESPADVLSCRFDANGNHRLFRQGSMRYSFDITDGTNQVNTITKTDIKDNRNTSDIYKMEYNSQGSVTAALHKNITKIDYDPLLNRPSSIEMGDGRKLKFEYDVRGERTFKQVIDKDGNVSKEKYYIRDMNRNVLVDLQLTFLAKDKIPDIQVTSYIYSDRVLVGFIRNDEFYSVFTDHEGSTRLVIKNGEVKAAYDYLPFGIIFRKSEKDLDGSISYLYTGQEWDEETGLYNYHTRLYDPEIGRFFQVDPKNQYASPYLYGGNSPIGMVDPDGQFFMTLIAVALAIVGAYLGAAAANGSWNPTEWDWKSTRTWLGLLTGAVTGATIPSSVASTLAYLTGTLGLSVSTAVSIMVGSGIGFTYMTMAAVNKDWNPDNWDMKSPSTWNAFFSGVSTTVSVITNPHSLATSYSAITSTVGKGLFIGGKLILTTGFAYMLGVIQQNGEFDPSKWDFSKPGLYMSLFGGAVQATAAVKFISNLPKNVKSFIEKLSNVFGKIKSLKIFAKFNQNLGTGWSKALSSTRHYLKAYSGNLKNVATGTFNIFLYTTVSSLRVSEIIHKNNVPTFGLLIELVKNLKKIGTFSDRLVSDLDLVFPDEDEPNKKSRLVRSILNQMENQPSSNATSGSSTIFRPLLDFISISGFQKFELPKTPIAKELKLYTRKTRSQSVKEYTIPNCFQLKDIENNNSFIKCYGYHSEATIHFKTVDSNVQGDRFSTCYPLSYNRIPSVSCEGEQSSFLFSTYEIPRLFDYVDGWILLTRVMPTVINNVVSGVRNIFEHHHEKFTPISKTKLVSLKKEQSTLDNLIKIGTNSVWARKAVNELNEDIEEYLKEPRRNLQTYWILKERIAALRDDIFEDDYMTRKQHQISVYSSKPNIHMLDISPTEIQNLMLGMLENRSVELLK